MSCFSHCGRRETRVCAEPKVVHNNSSMGQMEMEAKTRKFYKCGNDLEDGSQNEHFGLNLGDWMSQCIGFTSCGCRLLFGHSAQAVGSMLDALETCLEKVGSKLNASNTKSINASATTFNIDYTCRIGLGTLRRKNSHKLIFGCFYPWAMGNRQQNMNFRLQNASRAFQANRWIVCDKNMLVAVRLKFFDAMVMWEVCFAAGHRKFYVGELRKLAVHCQTMLRRTTTACRQWEWTMA